MEIEFKRVVSLKQSFFRIRVSETDLERFAKQTIEATRDLEGDVEIEIRIRTSNATFSTSDPSFFTDSSMPEELVAVSICFRPHSGPLRIELSFDNDRFDQKCYLRVWGTAARTNRVFDDLKKDLGSKVIFGHWLTRKLNASLGDSALVWMICATIVTTASLSACLTAMEWSGAFFPEAAIRDSFFSLVLILATVLGAGGGLFIAAKLVPICWPAVEFAGKIRDPGARYRRRFYWLIAAVLVPIAHRFFGNALADIFMNT